MDANESGYRAPVALPADDPDRATLAGLAADGTRQALGKEVELELQAVDRSGHWAVVRARLLDPGGAALSLGDTPFADAAAAGRVSDLAVVLFRLDEGQDADGWKVIDQAILPTDVAWLGWPQAHGVPSQLLGIGG